MKKIVFALTAASVLSSAWAQNAKRPRLLGLSQIVVRSHDLNASRHFYGDLLGFDEAFAIRRDHTAVVKSGLPADQVSAVFFKVNNRQYIVVMPESSPSESRFVRYAVETDNAETMRVYLKSLGYAVPAKVTKAPTYDLGFEVKDPDGTSIEVMQYTPESLSVQNVGKFLSENRLSNRMLHAGFAISKPESTKFYLDGFSVREFWRADPSMTAPGAAPRPQAVGSSGPLLASLSNLKMPEGDDYIEWSLARTRTNPGAGGHIALETPDMSKTLAAIQARPAFRDYTRKHEAHVGINHKWQGNFFDPDGTRTEFMEHDTADGLPSPMSHAPYF
ncbi:MAG TPA: VOC family protein [Bryobacteraceae bacterium]|nr:VOC family protein [Bryobacteraceae bacterium]